ncbi:MAG: CBS domain-containing protein [Burkholderiales bacterium]
MFEAHESHIVSRVFNLDDHTVGHIMTPRADLTVIDTEVDPAVTLELLKQSDYTRYPVVRGDVSNVVGVIDSGDLLAHYLKSGKLMPERVRKDAVFIPETVSVLEALETFKRSTRESLAFVVDEHGEVLGLITLTDVLKRITHDLGDEDEAADSGCCAMTDGTWLVEGSMSLSASASCSPRPWPSPARAAATTAPLAASSWPNWAALPPSRMSQTTAATAWRCWTWTASASTSCWSLRHATTPASEPPGARGLMLAIISVILPAAIIVIAGYVAGKRCSMRQASRHCPISSTSLFLPCLLFCSMATASFGGSDAKLLATYYGASLLWFFAVALFPQAAQVGSHAGRNRLRAGRRLLQHRAA